jgi:hypothetical protein
MSFDFSGGRDAPGWMPYAIIELIGYVLYFAGYITLRAADVLRSRAVVFYEPVVRKSGELTARDLRLPLSKRVNKSCQHILVDPELDDHPAAPKLTFVFRWKSCGSRCGWLFGLGTRFASPCCGVYRASGESTSILPRGIYLHCTVNNLYES